MVQIGREVNLNGRGASARIANPWPGAVVTVVERTGSTMDDCLALGLRGMPSGTAVVAGFQERGRGRAPGRRWLSPGVGEPPDDRAGARRGARVPAFPAAAAGRPRREPGRRGSDRYRTRHTVAERRDARGQEGRRDPLRVPRRAAARRASASTAFSGRSRPKSPTARAPCSWPRAARCSRSRCARSCSRACTRRSATAPGGPRSSGVSPGAAGACGWSRSARERPSRARCSGVDADGALLLRDDAGAIRRVAQGEISGSR